jgi:hypothetical protein
MWRLNRRLEGLVECKKGPYLAIRAFFVELLCQSQMTYLITALNRWLCRMLFSLPE